MNITFRYGHKNHKKKADQPISCKLPVGRKYFPPLAYTRANQVFRYEKQEDPPLKQSILKYHDILKLIIVPSK